jgi:hypothetical protein
MRRGEGVVRWWAEGPLRGARVGVATAAVLAAAAIAPAGAGAAIQAFTTPGSSTFSVPANVTSISVEAFGAAGGASGDGKAGGLGAEAHASSLVVTPGESLTVIVGGRGGNGVNGTPLEVCDWGAGGVNGGGEAGECDGEGAAAGGGGGASQVSRSGTKLIVAGGGGGAGANGTGGAGGAGGETGVAGTAGAAGGGGGGGGGTATTPGAGGAGQGGGQAGKVGGSGFGGEGGFWSDASGGGGGAGVFGGGGGGGSQNFSGGGGGGGSSMGPAGTVFTTGAEAGNGKVVITYVYSSTVEVAASAGVTLGEPISATATLTGGHEPGGSIEFSLYGPEDESCSGAPAFTSTVPLVVGTSTYGSGPFTPTAVGTYRWVATYSGDVENAMSASSCADPTASVAVAAPVITQPVPPTTPPTSPTTEPPATQTPPSTGTPPAATEKPAAPTAAGGAAPSVAIWHSPNTAHAPNANGDPRYTFVFGGDSSGGTYYCRLDKGPFKACPSTVVYRNLAKGRHVFKVKAVDAAGAESAVQTVAFKVGGGRSAARP